MGNIKLAHTPLDPAAPAVIKCWRCNKAISYEKQEVFVDPDLCHSEVCEACMLDVLIGNLVRPDPKTDFKQIADPAYAWLQAKSNTEQRLRLVLQDLANSVLYDRSIHESLGPSALGGCMTLAKYDAKVPEDKLEAAVKSIVLQRIKLGIPERLIPVLLHEIGCDLEIGYRIPVEEDNED